MDREFTHYGALESAIGEAGEAERAGVFTRTRVDARALLRPASTTAIRPIWLRRLGSIAAVLVIAVGVWTWMFVDQIGKLRGRAIGSGAAEVAAWSKLTGPAVASSKSVNDFDADGDLDLADFRTFQLQFSATR